MTTPVTGPGDVKPGDLVRVDLGNSFRQRIVTVAVDGISPTGLSFRTPEGRATRKMYTSKSSGVTFMRLNAHERWQASTPKTVDIDTPSSWYSPPLIPGTQKGSADLGAIRDRPDDVCAQVHALSAWLKAEPSKDAP